MNEFLIDNISEILNGMALDSCFSFLSSLDICSETIIVVVSTIVNLLADLGPSIFKNISVLPSQPYHQGVAFSGQNNGFLIILSYTVKVAGWII